MNEVEIGFTLTLLFDGVTLRFPTFLFELLFVLAQEVDSFLCKVGVLNQYFFAALHLLKNL